MDIEEQGLIGETERLIIRELTMKDSKAYYDIVNICRSGIDNTLLDLPFDIFEEKLEAYIKYQYGFYGYGIWAVELKGVPASDSFSDASEKNSRIIGTVGVWNSDESEIGEVGYCILPQYRMKGYCREAMTFVSQYAIEDIGFLGLIAQIAPENKASLNTIKGLNIKVKTL